MKRYNAMVVGDTEERKINFMGFVPPKLVVTTPVGKRRHRHKNGDISNENNRSPKKKIETQTTKSREERIMESF